MSLFLLSVRKRDIRTRPLTDTSVFQQMCLQMGFIHIDRVFSWGRNKPQLNTRAMSGCQKYKTPWLIACLHSIMTQPCVSVTLTLHPTRSFLLNKKLWLIHKIHPEANYESLEIFSDQSKCVLSTHCSVKKKMTEDFYGNLPATLKNRQ